MTQLPPENDNYDAEVRRRIEMANYPAAPPSPPAFGGDAGASGPMAQSEFAGLPPVPTKSPVVAVGIAVVAAVVIAGIVFGIVLVAGGGSDHTPMAAATSSDAAEETTKATPAATPEATPNATPEVTPGATPGVSGPPFASRLSVAEMYEAYSAMVKDGSIYEIVPATAEGADYAFAYIYSLIDLKAAVAFSGSLSPEQLVTLTQREQHFLALEDLEFTVDITLSDGTHFVYDGHPPAPA